MCNNIVIFQQLVIAIISTAAAATTTTKETMRMSRLLFRNSAIKDQWQQQLANNMDSQNYYQCIYISVCRIILVQLCLW
jgi:hypothetical protein